MFDDLDDPGPSPDAASLLAPVTARGRTLRRRRRVAAGAGSALGVTTVVALVLATGGSAGQQDSIRMEPAGPTPARATQTPVRVTPAKPRPTRTSLAPPAVAPAQPTAAPTRTGGATADPRRPRPVGGTGTSMPSPAAPLPPSAPSPTPTAAAPASCTPRDLEIGVGGGSGGAAGSVYTAVRLVDTGPRSCVLDGFPGVSYVGGADRHQVGNAAARSGTAAPVTLHPGGVAHATLRILDQGVFDPGTCRPTPVAGYRIYLPGSTTSTVWPFKGAGTACAGRTVTQLFIGPVQAGPPTD